jgi:hypothetical protein
MLVLDNFSVHKVRGYFGSFGGVCVTVLFLSVFLWVLIKFFVVKVEGGFEKA